MRYLGVVFLLLLVLVRWVMGRSKQKRFRHWWQEGVAAYERADWVAAESALRECVRMEPIAAPVRRMLGATLARRNKVAEAEEHLSAGVQLEPRNAGGHLDLGFFLAAYAPDRVDATIEAFAKAVACAPQARAVLAAETRLPPAIKNHPQFRSLCEPETPLK